MEQDMEGLEDNTIKQTNSCYFISKKKKYATLNKKSVYRIAYMVL